MSEPNEIYYVVLRGAGRQSIFVSDDDRRDFTDIVAAAAATCHLTVYAYCWLQSEARLAVAIADVPISQFAQRVADLHVRRWERHVALTGSHFEQKYRGVLVSGQTALLDLVRHIHLAPLKAGLTQDPAAYPWSSHRAYLGLEEAPWLALESALRCFADEGGDARRGYAEFMGQAVQRVETPATLSNVAADPRPQNEK